MKRLPKNCRYVKQQGYKRGWFHNWAVFYFNGFMISLGGRTKKEAREMALKALNS